MQGACGLALPFWSILHRPAPCRLSGCSCLLPGTTDTSKRPRALPSRQGPPAPALQAGSPTASAS